MLIIINLFEEIIFMDINMFTSQINEQTKHKSVMVTPNLNSQRS